MTIEQLRLVFTFLNATWPGKPIAVATQRVWGDILRRYPYEAVEAVLLQLALTSVWRPALATVIKALTADDDAPSADEAFGHVWDEIGRVGSYGTPDLDLRASETVRLLGGWATACASWTTENREWRRKEFVEVYNGVAERETERMLAAPPEKRALPGADGAAGLESDEP